MADNITETTQGHPEEPHMDDTLIINFADDDTGNASAKRLEKLTSTTKLSISLHSSK